MLLGLTYQLIRFIADLVLVRSCSNTQLRAEALALRHQLRVLERKVGKQAWQPGDRILLSALSQLLPRSGLPSLLPRPKPCSVGTVTWLGVSGPPSIGALPGNVRLAIPSGEH